MKRFILGSLMLLAVFMLAACGDDNKVAGFQITTASTPSATVGTAYSQTLAATGGTGTLTWSISVGALPPGLSLTPATGIISGTPTTAAPGANFTVMVTDSATPTAHTATKVFSITVTAPGALTVTTVSLPPASVGTNYNQTLTATGGTGAKIWSISAGTLPTWMSLTPAGLLSGTPITAAPAANFTVKVTDSATPTANTATMALSITVTAPGAFTVTTTSLPAEVLGSVYSQTLAATGGTGTLTWSISVGTLPPGLSLTPATGLISGTPTTSATANFTVTATDSATPTAHTAPMALSITSRTAAGLAAFNTNCGGCHGTLTPGVGVSGPSLIIFPSSITALNAAIAANRGGMSSLSGLGAATLSAIAGVLH